MVAFYEIFLRPEVQAALGAITVLTLLISFAKLFWPGGEDPKLKSMKGERKRKPESPKPDGIDYEVEGKKLAKKLWELPDDVRRGELRKLSQDNKRLYTCVMVFLDELRTKAKKQKGILQTALTGAGMQTLSNKDVLAGHGFDWEEEHKRIAEEEAEAEQIRSDQDAQLRKTHYRTGIEKKDVVIVSLHDLTPYVHIRKAGWQADDRLYGKIEIRGKDNKFLHQSGELVDDLAVDVAWDNAFIVNVEVPGYEPLRALIRELGKGSQYYELKKLPAPKRLPKPVEVGVEFDPSITANVYMVRKNDPQHVVIWDEGVKGKITRNVYEVGFDVIVKVRCRGYKPFRTEAYLGDDGLTVVVPMQRDVLVDLP